jgi:hypothetical protein
MNLTHVIDHSKTYLFEHAPELNLNIIHAEGVKSPIIIV